MSNQMLTTVDNPFNPFTNYDEWDSWDRRSGYHTNSLIGRVAITSPELSEADQDVAYQRAIEEIAEHNVSGVHRLIDPPTDWQVDSQADDTSGIDD